MHSIERELIKACEFKPRKKYNDRQEYLRAILVAANKLSDDDFDLLSDDAANWVDACIRVHNAHKNEDLPDFDEADEPEGAEDGEEDEGPDEDEAADDEAEADDGDDDADEADDESGASTEDEDEPEDEDDEADPDEEPEDGDDEEDEPEEVVEEAPKPARKKPGPPAKPKPPKGQPPVSVSAQKKLKDLPQDEGDVELDKWGCMIGSKNSLALAMFEKGATAKEIKAELGGTYYNILTKMVKRGHKLEREGHLMKLTHADEVIANKPKKSKK